MPTYACNVSCWYCTQKHRKVELNNDDIDRIKKHIIYYLTHNDINGLQLAWFGGEPLLNFRRINEIAAFAQTYCKEHNLNFFNTITTNGTLLNRSQLEKMRDYNFTFFQLTIDGRQEDHDHIKIIKGQSSYELTLKNVCQIVEIIPNAEICLRYNYTMQNMKPQAFIQDLNRYLPKEIREHINLSVMKVWQQDEREVSEEIVNDFIEMAMSNGYTVNYGSGFNTCYVDRNHFSCVFPNGLVDKCNNIDIEKCRGKIGDNGQIIWNEMPSFPKYTVFSHENECQRCSYLPICYGPCPKERDLAFKNRQPLKCRFPDRDKTWKQGIYHYCNKIIKQHAKKEVI